MEAYEAHVKAAGGLFCAAILEKTMPRRAKIFGK